MEPITHLRLRIRLNTAHGVIMGPGRAELLTLIDQTGSIAAAGRQMKMSYRRAWSLVESLNKSFTSPLVTTSKGGTKRGGAHLTALGKTLLGAYQELDTKMQKDSAPVLKLFESVLGTPP